MTTDPTTFHDEKSLSDRAETLGQEALQKGLISSFMVRFFVDSRQFYIPDEHQTPLTPEQAYMQFKRLLQQEK